MIALILNRLPHTRSRQVVVTALAAEGISTAFRTAVIADRNSAVTALCPGRLAARRPYVAVTGYVFDLAERIYGK
jgi:hypothetical protein